ncbi:hypothetical protein QBZ16_001050 [Prototheca wickerhamii]|uniref:Uncharacterized protein n=1 Tax=Prototheca wickerhamii TaxID=3111 RepID=A0AAD9IDS8_PROWI|nr:hypothetical protein QBZ16_001050 [Prototheca wickerhamii]
MTLCNQGTCKWLIAVECVVPGTRKCEPDDRNNTGRDNVGYRNFGIGNSGISNFGNYNKGNNLWGNNNTANVSCDICYPSSSSAVVYVGYADDASSRKKITRSTAAALSAFHAYKDSGVLYMTGTSTNLSVGKTYRVTLTCNGPTKYLWSNNLVATATSQSFNYSGGPTTSCTSVQFGIVKSVDEMEGAYA